MKRFLTIAATAAALVMGVALNTASAAPTKEKRVALVVGNSAYQTVPKLPNPTRDANAVAKLFREAGFDQVDVISDVGNLEFKRAIRKFEDTATEADIAVIFYAGHGIEIGGTNFLIPVDARLASDRDAIDEAIPLERMVASADGAKKLRVVILDACRDNPFAGKMRRESRAAMRGVATGLGKIEPTSTDTLIAYAAKAGSTAEDGETQHSPFTTALLKNIAVPGLDLRLAFGRVKDEVMKITNNRQEPFVYGSLGGGNFSLVPAPEETREAPATAADVKADYELVAKIGTARAWEVFLGTHKTGFYADLARAQLARLQTSPPAMPSQAPAPTPATFAPTPAPATPSNQEQLEWGRIKDSNDPDELAKFIAKYPNSPQALTAQRRKEQLEKIAREREEKARADKAEAERQKAAAAEAAQRAKAEEAERKAAEARRKADEAAKTKAAEEAARLKAESERVAREAEAERQKAKVAADVEAVCSTESARLNDIAAKGSEGQGLTNIRLLALESKCERLQPQITATLEKFDKESMKRNANTPDLIRLAQNNLNRIGCSAGEANGVMTDETRSALIRYMSSKGRPTDDLMVTNDLVNELNKQVSRTCVVASVQPTAPLPAPAAKQAPAPAKTVSRPKPEEKPAKKTAQKPRQESRPEPRAREQAQARPAQSSGGRSGGGATMIGVGF
jgi:uncharacterized caspase-like protein